MSSSIENISGQLKEHEIRNVALASALVIVENTDKSPPTALAIDHTVGAPLVWQVPGQMGTSEGCFQGFGTLDEGVAPRYEVLMAATEDSAAQKVLVPPA